MNDKTNNKPDLNSTILSTIRVEKANENDFETIKFLIQQFDLDNRNLELNQFLVAKQNNLLLGFGRIRKHNGCDEFCSLGVVEEKRYNGIAKLLIEARIEIATQPIYLVCIQPEYFEKLGFVIVNDYPPEIEDKLNYCTNELVVPENYVVMHYKN